MYDTCSAWHDHHPQGRNASTDFNVLWIENVKYAKFVSSFGIFVILIAARYQKLNAHN